MTLARWYALFTHQERDQMLAKVVISLLFWLVDRSNTFAPMARYLLGRVFARIGQCQELLRVVRGAEVELQHSSDGVS